MTKGAEKQCRSSWSRWTLRRESLKLLSIAPATTLTEGCLPPDSRPVSNCYRFGGCSPRSRQRWRTHSNKWLTRPESWRVLSIKHQDAPECVLTSIGKASPLRKYCVASLEFGVPGMDLLLCRRQTCVLTICHRPFSNKLKETTPSAISNYVQMTERGIFIRKYVSQVRFSIAYGAVLVRSVFDPQILPARATSQPF